MSGRKLDNWSISDTDWTQEIESKNILKRGWFNIDFSNLDATTESEIEAGSSIEINGVMYVFDSLESITGSVTSDSLNYIRVFDSSGVAVAEYTDIEPEWRQDLKGYYDTTGLKRYVFKFFYDSIYYAKQMINQRFGIYEYSENESFTEVESDYVVPFDSIRKKEIFINNYGENVSIELPDISGINMELKISGKSDFRIIQPESENIIKYRDIYQTTKGTDGYLQLSYQDYVKLIYTGNDYSINNPIEKIADPSSLPSSVSRDISFSSDNLYMAVADQGAVGILIYKISGDTFTKLSDPSYVLSDCRACGFSDDVTYLAKGSANSPYIVIYKRSGDTFTKLSDPATLPGGTVTGLDFSSDGVYLAVTVNASPEIIIYKRSGDTFTKLSDPATMPGGSVNRCKFSKNTNYLAVATSASPYIVIYKRSGDTFTKLSDPSVLPSFWGTSCDWSDDDRFLAVGHENSPFITVYKRSGDVFTKLSNPSTLPPGRCYSVKFSHDGRYLAVGSSTSSPFLIYYRIENEILTKLSNPSTMPSGLGYSIDISYDSKFLTFGSTNLYIYKLKNNVDKAWQILDIRTEDSDFSGMFH